MDHNSPNNDPRISDFAQSASDALFGNIHIPGDASLPPPGFANFPQLPTTLPQIQPQPNFPSYTQRPMQDYSFVQARHSFAGYSSQQTESSPMHDYSFSQKHSVPNEGEGSGSHQQPQTPTSAPPPPEKLNSKSWCWSYYERIMVPGQAENKTKKAYKAHCLPCRAKSIEKVLAWKLGEGTGTHVRHLESKHDLYYDEPSKQVINRGSGPKQTQLAAFMEETPGGGKPFFYNRDNMIDGMARYVAIDERPFNHAESWALTDFNRLHLNPQYDAVSRKLVKNAMVKQYHEIRTELISLFTAFKGRVSLTSDCWQSPQYESYICVTVHWCDSHYKIQKRIISFDWFEESHSAVNIYNRIKQTLLEFGLDTKLFSLSFDNASPNTAAIPYIQANLPLLINGKLLHVRCCAHILNLCVQDGLSQIHDIVHPIRHVLTWLRNTSNVKRKFKEYCRSHDLRVRRFSVDTKTRWNSTFVMLREALKYKDAITTIYNDEMIKSGSSNRVTEELWTLVERCCVLLETFYKATHVFSLVYEPNVHLVIVECVQLVSAMSGCIELTTRLDRVIQQMMHKWLAYLTEFPLIYGVATMLDPGLKKDSLKILLDNYYRMLDMPDYDVNAYVTKCVDVLLELYDLYYNELNPNPSSSSGSTRPPKSRRFGSIITGMISGKSKKTSSDSNGRAVLESYFQNEEFINEDDFSILQYWRGKEAQWPILTAIARDILVIPASTVASESAFSSGRRIITDYRTSMTEESVRVCVCLRDWLRAKKRTQDDATDDEKETEDDPWLPYTPGASGSGTPANN